MIPDTLQISYSRSLTSQPVPEGTELTLTCSAGIQSEQLTHLSIMFGKRGGGESMGSAAAEEVSTVREIISIDKMLSVVPGRSYRKRYDGGEITLEKRNGEAGLGVYVMRMKVLQPDDAGSYFCEASQWIRDPDRSWQKIAQRTMEIGNLTVRQLGETPCTRATFTVAASLASVCSSNRSPTVVSQAFPRPWTGCTSVFYWKQKQAVSSENTNLCISLFPRK